MKIAHLMSIFAATSSDISNKIYNKNINSSNFSELYFQPKIC